MTRRFLALCIAHMVLGVAGSYAQGVLPGYSGVFSQPELDILDFITLSPARVGELRNELYARYGRPFVSQLYRDFFAAKPWYRERADFTEAWLTPHERQLAQDLLRLEKPALGAEAFRDALLAVGEFRLDGDHTVLLLDRSEGLFVSGTSGDSGSDSPYGGSYASGYGSSGLYDERPIYWTVAGDWLVFTTNIAGGYITAYATLPNLDTGDCGPLYIRRDAYDLARQLGL